MQADILATVAPGNTQLFTEKFENIDADESSKIFKIGEFVKQYCFELFSNESRNLRYHHGIGIEEWKKQLLESEAEFAQARDVFMGVQLIGIVIVGIATTVVVVDLWRQRRRRRYERTNTVPH